MRFGSALEKVSSRSRRASVHASVIFAFVSPESFRSSLSKSMSDIFAKIRT